LQWTDGTTGESGFEIWRRKVLTPTTFAAWAMAPIASANSTSFIDTGLDPAATYQYKIRTINTAGRSNYTPSASNQFLTVTTQGDPNDPTTPTNLLAEQTAIREITLTWDASTDEETGIKQYRITANGSIILTPNSSTTYRFTNLPLNTVFNYTVAAIDKGDNVSPESSAATADSYVSGLYYEHSTGAWTDLDQIDWNVAEFKGKVPTVTLDPRTQEDFFNFEFDGYLYIEVAGTYQFRTTSDDGSRLTLNNVVVVDNDGTHGDRTTTSINQDIASGPHLANVKFFENSGGQSLTVQYRGADTRNNWQTIPEPAWRSGTLSTLAGGRIATDSAEPDFQVTVYPNPAQKYETLSIVAVNNVERQPIHIKLVSMMGETFYQKSLEADEVSAGMSIVPDKELLKGIYVLIIRRGDQTLQKRIIVND
jgi:hypothetical protein